MLPGEFIRKLQKLNRKLKVCCTNDDTKPAGLYYVDKDGYIPICSVDKNEIPRWTIANEKNKILKSGWQRTIRILVEKKFTTFKAAEKQFGPLDRCRVKIYKTEEGNNRIQDLEQKKFYYGDVDHNGQPVFSRNEVLDMKEELSRRT